MIINRRAFIAGLAASAIAPAASARLPLAAQVALTRVPSLAATFDVPLFGQAMTALDRLGASVSRDRIAIVDFAAPSSRPRFHLVDMERGEVTSLLTAHGSGSDPAHSGWLHSFSNRPGSNATCEGAFVTRDYYTGRHGLSQRLQGMDASNDMAMDRAIVLHAAWYAEPSMVAEHGKLGRSQGCFAFGEAGLAAAFAHLGQGRMIFAGKSA